MPESWHVAICASSGVLDVIREMANLDCISEVCAPTSTTKAVRRGRSVEVTRPWLGPLVLARWPGDDPYAWYDVINLPYVRGILGGWLPAVIPDNAVTRFINSIQELDNDATKQQKPPCVAGDIVRFSHLNIFYRIVGHCVWVAAGVVGIRVSILGRDATISVPYAGVEEVMRPRRRSRQFGKFPQFSLYNAKNAA